MQNANDANNAALRPHTHIRTHKHSRGATDYRQCDRTSDAATTRLSEQPSWQRHSHATQLCAHFQEWCTQQVTVPINRRGAAHNRMPHKGRRRELPYEESGDTPHDTRTSRSVGVLKDTSANAIPHRRDRTGRLVCAPSARSRTAPNSRLLRLLPTPFSSPYQDTCTPQH
jgi:hypothetical protein